MIEKVDLDAPAKLYAFPDVMPPDGYRRGGTVYEGTFGEAVKIFMSWVPARAAMARIGTREKVWKPAEIRNLVKRGDVAL